ncbi:response regulator transcription factor [Mangrovicoccus algicola]|uniref:Response regulator transcription factor n=1 Tax=Mangrovicoccus algicola TaxID=2771008 RepID=A0A8J6YYX6_9RHOB|nr:response regulator transcription factor [Mangrovicoccus algicola]MBE3638348.1 response regulator transcription factor [Mangrovicoccus algicola]
MPRQEAPRVLVVDDDPDIASVLARGLALKGFAVEIEMGAEPAARRLRGGGIDAAVIDVMLGQDSGLDLVADLRREGITLPVVMLSALAEIEDRSAGLRAGAEDYLVKPLDLEELSARLHVQIRRSTETAPGGARPWLDPAQRRLRLGAAGIDLTEREFALLRLLWESDGRPAARGEIFDRLWSGDAPGAENVVDVYIGYLRRKLARRPEFGLRIVTIRSRGFLLQAAS